MKIDLLTKQIIAQFAWVLVKLEKLNATNGNKEYWKNIRNWTQKYKMIHKESCKSQIFQSNQIYNKW